MAEPSDHTGLTQVLSTLRATPMWVLWGLALSGYAILHSAPIEGAEGAEFRKNWGSWIWALTITFAILGGAKAIDLIVVQIRKRQRNAIEARPLLFVPLDQQKWWYLAKQKDGTFSTQISFDANVINLASRPIKIAKVQLLRPRSGRELVQSSLMIPVQGSPYHSQHNPLLPYSPVIGSFHFMMKGAMGAAGKPLRVSVAVFDEAGEKYIINKIELPSRNTASKRPTLSEWISDVANKLRNLFTTSPELSVPDSLPTQWQHGGVFAEVDLILGGELRYYASNGRQKGGLGSLNINIQNSSTLFRKSVDAVTVSSPNATRLIAFAESLNRPNKVALSDYLLSHLHKKSPFAKASYFIFFALHRLGRTVDALSAARRNLAGDQVDGYSNLLAVLSALVGNEHHTIEDHTLEEITRTLVDESEHKFFLDEKISEARLLKLDQTIGQRIEP